MIRRLLIVLALLTPGIAGRAGSDFAPRDTVTTLDSTVVSAVSNSSLIVPGIGIESNVRTELLFRAPSLMGNSDPLRFVRMLPGVSIGSELDAGIHIQGTEHQHCIVSAEGVPIYGASHLLGLFSVFIPKHYKAMEYCADEKGANRLGGAIDMRLQDERPDKVHGSVSSGLISSEGSFSFPLGNRAAAFMSLRKSYINLLYGSYLKLDGNTFKYGFGDANLTFLWRPSEQDVLWLDSYAGMDDLGYGSFENGMDVDMDWHNMMGALHWKRQLDGWSLKQSLYHTSFGLGMDVRHDYFDIKMPSGIRTLGYKANLDHGRWNLQADLGIHRARPQRISSIGGYFRQTSPKELQKGIEASLALRYAIIYNVQWKISATAKGQLWHDAAAIHPYFSPEIDALFNAGRLGHISASAGIRRQFLSQTGLSSVALPYEFWLLAGKYNKPQSSMYGRLTYDKDLEEGAYRLSAELYWRELSNQIEYKGSVLDFVREDYALENALLKGNGRNYGLSILFRKQAGRLTGWLGYTVGRSLRSFDDPEYPSVYPANHERIHEFNAMFSWTVRKWELSGSFVAASGTPFTAVESMYVTQGQLLCNFGGHNEGRFKPYIRLDFSANYYFKRIPGGREHGLNFSLFNATGRKNDIFYMINVEEDRKFTYCSIYYKVMFLPSIGYFYRF
ncbi:MAG: hypothetical protein J5771_01800 [Bacteroidales bacterium]|nr:hypothetical protein [Bacteroidales bacterium]